MADGGWARPGQTVTVRLDEPPRVVSPRVGVHRTTSQADGFRLPDLWQLHLYRYAADLHVAGEPHAIRPGYVSLSLPVRRSATAAAGGPSTSTYICGCRATAIRSPSPSCRTPVLSPRCSPSSCSGPSRRLRAVPAGHAGRMRGGGQVRGTAVEGRARTWPAATRPLWRTPNRPRDARPLPICLAATTTLWPPLYGAGAAVLVGAAAWSRDRARARNGAPPASSAVGPAGAGARQDGVR